VRTTRRPHDRVPAGQRGTVGAMSALHPISVGLVSTGTTGAQNYDEFADDAEITALVTANPDSMLGVEMPHRTPEAVADGLDFAAALPAAAARLAGLLERGKLIPFADALAVYRIGEHFLGMFCLVDTAEIAAGPGAPGRVIRNEEVFAAKVAERTALIRTLGVLASPVLLVQASGTLYDVLADVVRTAGEPTTTDVDQHGREHAVWLVGPGADQDRLLAAADAGELVVADGNHRSLAAQEAGLTRFLAVVAPAGSASIQPYQRLIRRLPMPVAEILDGLRAAGAGVQAVDERPATPARGTVVLYAGRRTYEVKLPPLEPGSPAPATVDRLDHTVVEQLLVRQVLGLTPDDPSITYVGGDYSADWLATEVDAGRAALAVLLAPVTVEDFVDVNLARATMPRKSTWFTPKARTGLVLADVHEDLGTVFAPGGDQAADVQPEALSR